MFRAATPTRQSRFSPAPSRAYSVADGFEDDGGGQSEDPESLSGLGEHLEEGELHGSALPAPEASLILDGIPRMWRYARKHGFADDLKSLHRPRIGRSLAAVVGDWTIIAGAFAIARAAGFWAVPLALVVIGNRQRALGNLLHDAAHGNFCRNRRLSDRLALWLLFNPMWTSLEIYRREHFAHHRYLGVPGHDVDLIHREEDMDKPWILLLWRHAVDPPTWKGSTFAHLPRAARRELAMMSAWWIGVLSAIAWVAQPTAALEFAAIWWAARATAFHLITTFREISDHVGLRPGTLMGFSRNHTSHGPPGALFHPHNNGYHLVHHLNPGMPFHALPRAHALLLQWPEYAAASHSDHYFFGDKSLVRSWVRGSDRGQAASSR